MHPPLTFVWPQLLPLLWALPVLPLAYLWLLRRRRAPALRYASLSLVRPALGAHRPWRRHVPPALLLLGLAAVLLASARPLATLPLPTRQATVMLAVDVSLSMEADDILPSRLEAARAAARNFVRRLPPDVRVGVVSFAAVALVTQPPTRDREAVLAAIDRLHLQHGTAVGSGIVAALGQLFPELRLDAEDSMRAALRGERAHQLLPAAPGRPADDGPQAAIVLLTDGRSAYGVPPLYAADMAGRLGVPVHAIGLGRIDQAAAGEDDWAMAWQLDEGMLQAITARTSGLYFRAGSAAALLRVYQQLGAHWQLEPRRTELAAPLALCALLLLGSAAGLSLLWRARVA